MKELLKSHKELTDAIFRSFGIENGYGDIDDKTDFKWDFTTDSIHWAEEDKDVMLNSFKNIKSYWPEMDNINQILDEAFNNDGPCYINLKR